MSEDQTLNLSDFAKVIDFNSLYQSYTEARKGKRWKYAVCKYEVNVLENLMFVHFMLSAHKYRLSPYNCFIVKEPKERLIMYNSFRDKIVQHSLCDNVLEPYLSKTFIYDNYFYLIHPDKDYLRYCLEEIKKYLVPLGLELNQKTAIFPLTQGIDFLGFRTYLTDTGKVVRKVRRESKNRIRRKLKKYRHLLDEGRIDFETILQSYSSWTGHAEHGNSYHLIRKTDDLFFNLFKNELEGLTYGKITIRFARWKRCQVDEHEIQRESDQVDRGNPGHSQRPNGPGDRENDHSEMLRREGAFEHER